jgi:HlyD family secretion protein
VARLQPESPPLLDARTRAEATAALASAEAALGHARAEEQRARAALDHAQRELTRGQRLTEAGVTTVQEREAREADVKMANELVNAATFAVGAASADVERARTRLTVPPNVGLRSVAVVAPATGVVLRRLRESEAVVPTGEPLIELGDPAELEVVTDLLSTDAVSVAVGARATIEQWGGTPVLAATVRRIEPAGFTKISALGVEEQRVNVVLDFADPVAAYARLGDAYRVEVRIVLWEAPDVLKVPTGALFRDGDAWAVYVTDNGRARLAHVALGRQTGREAEVASGLSEGARVIVHPGDLVRDGVRVEDPTV